MPRKAVAVTTYDGTTRRFWTGKVVVDVDGDLLVGKNGRVARYQSKAWASYEVYEVPSEEQKATQNRKAFTDGYLAGVGARTPRRYYTY